MKFPYEQPKAVKTPGPPLARSIQQKQTVGAPPVYRPSNVVAPPPPPRLPGAAPPAQLKPQPVRAPLAPPPVYRPQSPVQQPTANRTAFAPPPAARPGANPIRTGPPALARPPQVPSPRSLVQRSPAPQAAGQPHQVIQRTVWEWKDDRGWRPVRTEGLPTARPDYDGYDGQRVSTGTEDPWYEPPRLVATPTATATATATVVEESGKHDKLNARLERNSGDGRWKLVNARESTKRNHAEELVAGDIASGSEYRITLNAWPCTGERGHNCHALLQQTANSNNVTITAICTSDHGGYAANHHRAGPTGTITYAPNEEPAYS